MGFANPNPNPNPNPTLNPTLNPTPTPTLTLHPKGRPNQVRSILKENVSSARLEALWRKLDEDGSGFIMAGEFSKFMRLGYDAMIEEQERIKSMRTRPVWTAVGKIYEEKPNFKEIQAERLRKMHESLRCNILRLESQSAKLEAEAAQAEAQLRRLAGRGVASPRSGALSPRAGALSPRSATASGPAKLS